MANRPDGRGYVADGHQLEFTVTTLVIGLPRQVVVQRCRRTDVHGAARPRRRASSPFVAAQQLLLTPATGGRTVS